MIRTQEKLKTLLDRLGLYVFIEEHENGDYLGVCNTIETDADIYIYNDGEVIYMNNSEDKHNILATQGAETLAQAMAFINSYQLFKLLNKNS